MKKILTLFAVAAALMTVSCSKENQAPEAQDGKTIQLTLQATRGEADTKTAITMNEEYHSLESVWAAGDKIYVYSVKSGEELGVLTLTGDIVDQKASATSQYPTSYAAFIGRIDLGVGDAIGDTFAFVYQGNRTKVNVSDEKLTFPMGTSATVAGLNEWDVAYATGKIQGSAGTENGASCAVSFTNKIGFGYFTTTPVASGSDIVMNYYSSFTLNVKTGAITGVTGTVAVPGNAAFFMPLIPGTVNITSTKVWTKPADDWGYTAAVQQNTFTASPGYYYRLGSAGSFGPVEFQPTAWTRYETLKNSTFAIGPSQFVHFTQGNLQWIGTDPIVATEGYWKIADTQYSLLKSANALPTTSTTGSLLNAGNVDLFGWGEVTPPFLGSNVISDYAPSVTAGILDTDWSTKFNGVSPTPLYADARLTYPKPTGDGNYCVLSGDEWTYLFAHHYWGAATVTLTDLSTVRGVVICPSSVDTESKADAILTKWYMSSASQKPSYGDNYLYQSDIDTKGLLFLCSEGGWRDGTSLTYYNSGYGYYWTKQTGSSTTAYRIYIEPGSVVPVQTSGNRSRGLCVRLATMIP